MTVTNMYVVFNMTKNNLMESHYKYQWLHIFSQIIGWIYFFAWSISFFPQLYINWYRKSVKGLSFEFLAYNFTGFLFYATYTTVNYFVQQSNPDITNSVAMNDLVFGFFAWLMTLLTVIQCLLYERGGQTVDRRHAVIILILWVLAIYNFILAALGYLPWYTSSDADNAWNCMQYLGVSKSFISFVKGIPQAYMNYKRQSTVGWSIHNILLDLTGGTLSFLQSFLDGFNTGDWGYVFGNIPMVMLSLVTIIFDILFITQHYVLYTNRYDESIVARKSTNVRSSFLKKSDVEEGPIEVYTRNVNNKH